MACTVTLPSSSLLPYKIPPRLMENARADCTYDWNMLAACLSKDTDAQCGSSCLCKPSHAENQNNNNNIAFQLMMS